MPNTIKIKFSGRYEEAPAAAAIMPGNLVELTAALKAQKQATRGADCAKAFAFEHSLDGSNIDTAIAADDVCSILYPNPGDEIYAFISAGENIAKGDKLSATGDGTLEKVSSTYKALAIALEAIDLRQTGDVDTRIVVRIL